MEGDVISLHIPLWSESVQFWSINLLSRSDFSVFFSRFTIDRLHFHMLGCRGSTFHTIPAHQFSHGPSWLIQMQKVEPFWETSTRIYHRSNLILFAKVSEQLPDDIAQYNLQRAKVQRWTEATAHIKSTQDTCRKHMSFPKPGHTRFV